MNTDPTGSNGGILDQDKTEIIRGQNDYMRNEIEQMQQIFERERVEKANLAASLIDIIYETKLPEHFDIVDPTSTTNDSTVKKYEAIMGVTELRRVDATNMPIIPDSMTKEYPIAGNEAAFTKENIKKAPWVNDIHAWMKVLNCANTLSAIQKNKVNTSDIPATVGSIAEELYAFTTESDRKSFLRTSEQFTNGKKFPETVQRECGTEGVNGVRHVSLGEMKYILQTMKKAFAKQVYT